MAEEKKTSAPATKATKKTPAKKKAAAKKAPAKKGRGSFSEAIKDKARKMVADGMTRTQVAEEIGTTIQTVSAWVGKQTRKAKKAGRATTSDSTEVQRLRMKVEILEDMLAKALRK